MKYDNPTINIKKFEVRQYFNLKKIDQLVRLYSKMYTTLVDIESVIIDGYFNSYLRIDWTKYNVKQCINYISRGIKDSLRSYMYSTENLYRTKTRRGNFNLIKETIFKNSNFFN